MKTGSKRTTSKRSGWRGPLYIDASALAKLYLPEPESEGLQAALTGRVDLVVSDLAITEVVSAAARRRRAGHLTATVATRLHQAILSDLDAGLFHKVELLSSTHRDAERTLLSVDFAALRAGDSLHIAMAVDAGAASMVTFDRRMADAAARAGLAAVP